MEGPSLVIACEEIKPLLKKRIQDATGSANLPFKDIKRGSLILADHWGKHLLLFFTHTQMRIHFLMFGSYRIDNPRPQRIPKLQLRIDGHTVYFYSCAIKVQAKGFEKLYDFSIDLMSPKWDGRQAQQRVKSKPAAKICDVLMDQNVFAGLGNIMKNEILFNLRMHPETTIEKLSAARIRALTKECHTYAWQFYEWKKINQLKRNWLIMRKKKCPICGRKVRKRPTGKLARISHFCTHCQTKN